MIRPQRVFLFSFFLLFSVHPLTAQQFGFGVTGGVRTTDDITGNVTSESRRYTVGPTAELGLPLGFGLEVDALYRRFGYTTSAAFLGGFFTDRERANSWEFPILVKHRLPGLIAHPFAEIGYAPRVMSGSGVRDSTLINLQTGATTHTNTHSNTDYDSSHGLVIGAGVEARFAKLHISPQIRYTRWNNTPVYVNGSQGYFLQSTQNQVDILLGITWH